MAAWWPGASQNGHEAPSQLPPSVCHASNALNALCTGDTIDWCVQASGGLPQLNIVHRHWGQLGTELGRGEGAIRTAGLVCCVNAEGEYGVSEYIPGLCPGINRHYFSGMDVRRRVVPAGLSHNAA